MHSVCAKVQDLARVSAWRPAQRYAGAHPEESRLVPAFVAGKHLRRLQRRAWLSLQGEWPLKHD